MKTIFGWAGTCLLTVWSYLLQLSRWTSRWEVVEQLHPGHICVFVMCHSSDSWLWSVLSLLITEDITCISPQQYSEALLIYWSYEILGVMGTLFLLINMGVTSGWVLIICRVWWDFINCLQTQIGWVGPVLDTEHMLVKYCLCVTGTDQYYTSSCTGHPASTNCCCLLWPVALVPWLTSHIHNTNKIYFYIENIGDIWYNLWY